MYAIIRGDLEMSPGKMAAQAGHAFLDTFKQCQEDDPDRAKLYSSDGHGTKVVLEAPGEFEAWNAGNRAHEAKLPTIEIHDSGHVLPPHFDGKPILTAVGIGPATRAEVHDLVKHFQLVK